MSEEYQSLEQWIVRNRRTGLRCVVQTDASGVSAFPSRGEVGCRVLPQDETSAIRVARRLSRCKIPYAVVGAGTNLLVGDRGARCVCLDMRDVRAPMRNVGYGVFYVPAGVRLSALAAQARHAGLSGLEALSGIPGTVGGAVAMNAGAFGTEIGQRVVCVRAMRRTGNVVLRSGEQMQWGYRDSAIARTGEIVLGAYLRLETDDPARIGARMEVYRAKRAASQPAQPSLGSVFRRAEGRSAGWYIERAGLKGLALNGVAISTKHANFIVAQSDGACADDFVRLARLAAEQVDKHCAVTLQYEVKILTDFGIADPQGYCVCLTE